MKKGVTKMSKRISAWILTLVMIVGLVAVPAKEVKAAGDTVTVTNATDSSKSVYVELKATKTIPVGTWGDNSPSVELKEYSVTVYNKTSGTISDWEVTINSPDASSWNAGWNGASRNGNVITIGTYKGTGDDGVWSNAEIAAGETGSGAGFQIAASAIENANVTLTYKEGETSGNVSKDDTLTDPSVLGDKSDKVTATIKKDEISGEYHAYYLQVNNGLSESISDWIVVIPLEGITSSEQWGDWAKVKTSYTSSCLYLTPATATVISAGGTFGSTSEGAYKFNYKGSKDLDDSKAVVYYKTGTTSSGVFDNVVDNATQAGGSGGSGNTGGSGGVQGDTTTDVNLEVEYNFAKLLQYSLYFYDANMCGELEGKCAVDWRSNCHLADKTAVSYQGKTVDVSGGFHDAGDHDKFGLPQGYTASVLGMGYYEFKEAYEKTGQVSHFKTILDYFCDYFVRCTVLDDSGNAIAFCYQVGDGASHNYWVSAETENINRPAYFADSSNPATDQVSEAAAALAIHYMNFGNKEYLDCAKKLFAMAKKNSKAAKGSDGGDFYGSSSWADDYCLAAAWLYKATNDSSYLTEYNANKGSIATGAWPSWDQVGPYALAYGSGDFSPLAANATTTLNGTQTISNGYAWLCMWGSARYNCNIQLEGLIYDKNTDKDQYTTWANGQMKFLLGNSENKRCYVVGYNENSSKYPHHRSASGYSGWPGNGNNHTVQAHVLTGALVGGIESSDGTYHDDSNDYYCNEVAIDYNAAFTGAAAALYLLNENDEDQMLDSNYPIDDGADCPANEGGIAKNGGDTPSDPVAVTDVSLEEKNITLKVKDTKKLTATIAPANATNKKVTWKSNDDKVATVDANGVVTAVGKGTTEITVTTVDGEFTDSCAVTVTNPVTDFTLSDTAIKLKRGALHQLTYTVTPKDPDEYTISWSSDKESVATVDKGKVTVKEDAEKGATATITATLTSGKTTITKICTVTVIVPLEKITLDTTDLKLNRGDTHTLVVSPYPLDADWDPDEVVWTSSNGKAATVDEDGTVTAVATGDAVITATVGKVTATCKVTVKTPVTRISIPATLEMALNDAPESLTVTYFPKDADKDSQKVNWASENSNIVSVDENGKVTIGAAAKAKDKVIITATLVDNPEISAQCEVSIVSVKVEKVTLNSTDIELEVDDTHQLTATVTPEDADNADNIKWTTSDETVATVSENGLVTAIAGGEATITAWAGSMSATCTVTVNKKEQEPPTTVTLTKVSRTNKSITVSATFTSDTEDISGKLEILINKEGATWKELNTDNQVTFKDLTGFTGYTFKARLAGSDKYEASKEVDVETTIYTLVDDPYTVDVSKLAEPNPVDEYVDAHRATDDADPTISFDKNKDELTLLEEDKDYTITGKNDKITIVTKKGKKHKITLKDTTIKQVDVSESEEVDITIVGDVTVKDGIVSSGDTDIKIGGKGRKGTLHTPSVRTEGDVTIEDVTVEADASESKPSGPAISGENVTITDSKVDAVGGDGSPAIEAEDSITITDSEVNAKGGNNAPAIEAGEDVTITDSNVSAEAGAGAPAIKGKNVELLTEESSDSDIDLKADEGQKGVEADRIVVDSPNVSFNGKSDANPDDIYSVPPVDRNGDAITGGGNGNGGNGGNNNGNNNNGNDNKDTNPIGDTKTQATSLTLTGSVTGAKNIPVGKTIKLAPKKKITLNVSFAPEDAEKESLTFTSNKPSIAKVDSKGKVTAGKKAGKATITIQSANGLKKTVTVQVMKKAVSKVKIKAPKTTIKVKKTVKLKVTLTPNKKNASNNVFWKSSKPKVATVSSKGVVKGVKKGKAKITAVATDGSGKKATVTIQVK